MFALAATHELASDAEEALSSVIPVAAAALPKTSRIVAASVRLTVVLGEAVAALVASWARAE